MYSRFFSILLAAVMLFAVVGAPDNAAAQAIPLPRPNGDLLLADDFNDAGQSALQSFGDEYMRWRVGGGVGQLASSSADDELSAQYATPIVADLLLDVELRIASSETDGAGVTFRGTNLREAQGTAWHYYHIGVRPNDRIVELGLLTEGAQDVEQVDTCRLPPSLSNFDDFRQVRVEAVGSEFSVFVDRTFVCTMTDDTLREPGLVGLYVGVAEDVSTKGEAVAEFTNLRVYAPLSVAASSEPAAPLATKTPPIAQPASTRFEDDFSSSKNGWTLGANDNGEVRIADDVLLIRNVTASDYRREATPGIVAADVTIELDSWLVSGTDDNWHSVFCRGSENGNYYSFSFSADGYYAGLLRIDGQTEREQKPTRTDAVNMGIDARNHVKLACLGDRQQFWVNDVLLIDWTDDTLREGNFGLAVSALDGEYSEAAFDNFVAAMGATGQAGDQSAPAAELEAIVTAPTLNVRSGPGALFTKVGTVSAGDRLPVLESNADCSWVKVVTPTTLGWISTGYATLTGECGGVAPQATPEAVATRPAAAATSAPTAQTAAGSPLITDFESFGTWRRGDETWGEFRQSSAEVYSGRYAGELSYDFPANVPGDRNYVVFLRSMPIAGEPDALEMRVYGDGSESFLNIWVKDAAGQVWQFTFGQIMHTGWKRMFAPLDPTLDWPVQPVGGSATTLRYPISLHALVLDYPTSDAASGVIYVDDLQALYPE